jgi:hypothetical protein
VDRPGRDEDVGLVVPFVLFTVIYLGLGAVVLYLMRRTILQTAPGGSGR